MVDLTLETRGLAHLSRVMKKLDAVKGIVGVTRIGDETSRKTGVDTSV
jgi:predicted RNA-binding protein with RPS1 domain